MAKFLPDEQALAQKIADLLHQEGDSARAFDLYAKLLAEEGLDKQFRMSLLEGGTKIAEETGNSERAFRWRSELLELQKPPEVAK
jgi:hypothetical protein